MSGAHQGSRGHGTTTAAHHMQSHGTSRLMDFRQVRQPFSTCKEKKGGKRWLQSGHLTGVHRGCVLSLGVDAGINPMGHTGERTGIMRWFLGGLVIIILIIYYIHRINSFFMAMAGRA